VSSLGALITVLALAVGPFVQQATSFQLEQVASSQNSTLPVRLTFANDWSAFYKGVVYDGLFGFGNSTLIPDCPSGNCSWLSYQTLAVCSRCVNVTGLVSYLQLNEQVQSCDPYHTSCRWTLPNGLALGNSFEVGHNSTMINTSGTLPPMMLDKVGYAIANFSLLARRDEYGPWATECSLYWCVNTYTATATNTIFNENFHNSWSNATLTKHDNGYFGTTVYNITPPTGSAKSQPNVRLSNTTMDYYRSTINSQGYYLVGADHTFGAWLGPLLSGNSTPYSDPAFSSDVVELFNYDTRQVPVIFARLAQCLTIAIRTAEDLEDNSWMAQALGVTWMSETMVRVQWAWLSLPCALLLASFVFLRVTAVGTARGKLGIWKSSTLALLFHGLGARDGDWVEGSGHLVGMKETAERMRVRLVDEGNGGGVLVEGYDLGGRGGGGLGWKWGAGEK